MLQVKERLGDFEIIRLLGKGGMGEVYEARQFNPDRRVALKVLAPWLADDDESLQRFMKEAAVPANLDHPGIVRIISTGKENGIAYFTMHLVRGVSLSEMIRRANAAPSTDAPTRSVDEGNTPSAVEPAQTTDNPPLSPAPEADGDPPVLKAYRHDRFLTVARIGAQAARALAFAHEQGVLHRDIKPSNLMVDFHNYVYLVDFGLTRALEQRGGDSTLPGTLIGTPWYMSPEQAESKPLDARSDIYSLGVTLYELATQGMGPFTASRDNKQSVLAEVRAGKTLPLRMLAHEIPPALEQIILRAMQLKPSKRYASAADMARELEMFCGHSAEMSPHPVKRPVVRARRRWPILVGGGVIVMVVVAVAALAIGWGRDPEVVEPPSRKLDGSRAQPPLLGDKENLEVQINLLEKTGAPRFTEYLFGSKKVALIADHFALHADTMLAIADPDRESFEFKVEPNGLAPDAEYGVFFGWRRRTEKSTAPQRVFLIQYKSHEKVEGEIVLGTAGIIQGNAVITDGVQGWMNQLPAGKNRQSLPSRNSMGGKMFLKVRVDGDDVTVHVPLRKPVSFSLSQLKRDNPMRYQGFSTAGAVGVWCKKRAAIFQDPSVTPLRN